MKEIEKIYLNEISLRNLDKMTNNQLFAIKHPNIPELEINIEKEVKFEKILNQTVAFYSDLKQISDNSNKIFPIHQVKLANKELLGYINQLLSAEDKVSYTYYRSLKEKELQINDIIEFSDGKKGVVCFYKDFHIPNIRYIPLKKDGNPSKSEPRIIYSGVDYKVVGKM